MRALRIDPALLEQAPTDAEHKHYGQECYIADSDMLEAALYHEYGRHGLCLKVFKDAGDPPTYGGAPLEEATKAQNLLAIDDLAPRVYEIVKVAGKIAQVTDWATGDGKPDYERMAHLVKKYKLGLKGKKGDLVKEAVRYTRMEFKWVGRWFVDWGRFYFTDPKAYEKRLRKKIMIRSKVPGTMIGYQDVSELGIPGQRDHRHRVKHMQLDGLDFRGKTVLDVGCNNGTMLREAVRRGAKRAVGIDDRRTHVWAELNNWLGYWGIDFLTLSMPGEYKAIAALIGIEKWDIVFALAIVQHIEGGYQPWFGELTGGVFYLEGNWETERETYWPDLERDFRQVEWLGWIKDEDKRPLYRCWQVPRPRWGALPRGAKARKAEAVQRGQSIFGQVMLSAEELDYLYVLADTAPNGPACEVGAFCGSSVMTWASARLNRGPMAAIDIESRPELEENIKHSGYPIEILIGKSWEAAIAVPDLAFCFIDGDHTKEGIPHDIEVYGPKIVPGGVIAFHDYDADEKKRGKGYVVKATVDTWDRQAQWEDLGLIGRIKAYRRPNDNDAQSGTLPATPTRRRPRQQRIHSEVTSLGRDTGEDVQATAPVSEGVQEAPAGDDAGAV